VRGGFVIATGSPFERPIQKSQTLIFQRLATKTGKSNSKKLRCFDNFAGLDAAGADLNTGVAAVRKLDAHRLKIRIKTPTSLIVGV
jgi:hypothetical protein